MAQNKVSETRYHQRLLSGVYTLYLFTKSDFKTVIGPTTAFAISNAFFLESESRGYIKESLGLQDSRHLTLRLSLAVLWTWLGLLVENLANQRLPHSVLEDAVNKPWRPIPSGRISSERARRLLIGALGVAYLVSVVAGAQGPFLALIVFTYLYNDLGGANEHLVLRNILNACGLMSFGIGATLIVAGGPEDVSNRIQTCISAGVEITPRLWTWVAMLGSLITMTVSTQDLEDVEGDRLRKRRTLPLVLGANTSRIYLAVSILCWNLVCSAFWQVRTFEQCVPAMIGFALTVNLLADRSIHGDKLSWNLWCAWVLALYLLPILCINH